MQAYNRLDRKVKQCQDLDDPLAQDLVSQAKSLAKLGDDLTLDHILDLERQVNQLLEGKE